MYFNKVYNERRFDMWFIPATGLSLFTTLSFLWCLILVQDFSMLLKQRRNNTSHLVMFGFYSIWNRIGRDYFVFMFNDKFLTGQLYGAVTYSADRCISSIKIPLGIETGIFQTPQKAL